MRYHTRNTLASLKDRIYKAAEAADRRGDTEAAEFLEDICEQMLDFLMSEPTYKRSDVRFQHDDKEDS